MFIITSQPLSLSSAPESSRKHPMSVGINKMSLVTWLNIEIPLNDHNILGIWPHNQRDGSGRFGFEIRSVLWEGTQPQKPETHLAQLLFWPWKTIASGFRAKTKSSNMYGFLWSWEGGLPLCVGGDGRQPCKWFNGQHKASLGQQWLKQVCKP